MENYRYGIHNGETKEGVFESSQAAKLAASKWAGKAKGKWAIDTLHDGEVIAWKKKIGNTYLWVCKQN